MWIVSFPKLTASTRNAHFYFVTFCRKKIYNSSLKLESGLGRH